jgi:hypothetical protein
MHINIFLSRKDFRLSMKTNTQKHLYNGFSSFFFSKSIDKLEIFLYSHLLAFLKVNFTGIKIIKNNSLYSKIRREKKKGFKLVLILNVASFIFFCIKKSL